jgi:hypothetical protein
MFQDFLNSKHPREKERREERWTLFNRVDNQKERKQMDNGKFYLER